MSSQEKIEPCPFCGHVMDASDPDIYPTGKLYIACPNCAAEGPVTQENGPIAAWNRRAPSEREKAREAIVEASLRAFAEQDGSEDFGKRVHRGCIDLAKAVKDYRSLGDA